MVAASIALRLRRSMRVWSRAHVAPLPSRRKAPIEGNLITFALDPKGKEKVAVHEHPGGAPAAMDITQYYSRLCGASQGLARTLIAIQVGCKRVAAELRRGEHSALREHGFHGDVRRLDIVAADHFIAALRIPDVCALSLEPLEEIISHDWPPEAFSGLGEDRYAVVINPLDGSQNSGAALSMGSIFGVYRVSAARAADASPEEHVCRSPKELIAAGYALYGHHVLLMCSAGEGLQAFSLDHAHGDFVLARSGIRTPRRGRVLSVNQGHASKWDDTTREFVDGVIWSPRPPSLHYVGTMVSDVHRTLLQGGLFCCPAHRLAPRGKLRMVHEAGPMAFLAEQSGAAAVNGRARLMDITPRHLSERSPVFIGSFDDVGDYVAKIVAAEAAESKQTTAPAPERPPDVAGPRRANVKAANVLRGKARSLDGVRKGLEVDRREASQSRALQAHVCVQQS